VGLTPWYLKLQTLRGAMTGLVFLALAPQPVGIQSMSATKWNAVDNYLSDRILSDDSEFNEILIASEAAELPEIQVSACQGKFLEVFARAVGARRILEVGTLGGYSAAWMSRALPKGGHLITLELEDAYAKVARANLERVGVADKVEIIVGDAIASLEALIRQSVEPFDLIFIDADKTQYPEYLACALPLSRAGTTIIADNIVRDGAIVDPDSDDPRVHGVRRFIEDVHATPHLIASALQTVGAKGYDGFLIANVVSG